MDPWYGASHELTLPGLAKPIAIDVAKITAIWAVEAALVSGILLVVVRLSQYSRPAGGRQQDGGRRRDPGGDEHRL